MNWYVFLHGDLNLIIPDDTNGRKEVMEIVEDYTSQGFLLKDIVIIRGELYKYVPPKNAPILVKVS